MYTILPLALILYFVYAQLPQKEENVARDRRLHFDTLVAYLGTATSVALFYFQFPIEWVVVSWAALVFALLGAALALDKPLFLQHALLQEERLIQGERSTEQGKHQGRPGNDDPLDGKLKVKERDARRRPQVGDERVKVQAAVARNVFLFLRQLRVHEIQNQGQRKN